MIRLHTRLTASIPAENRRRTLQALQSTRRMRYNSGDWKLIRKPLSPNR
jgi:hypothetical protein